MNNAKIELKKGVSKTQNEYYYLSVILGGKEINRIFIRETEVLYYQNLLGK